MQKRLTAKKACISEIVNGKFIQKPGFESNYVLTTMGRKLSRVRILGTVVDKFLSEDNNYATITLDDTSETIRCKIFMNLDMLKNVNIGDVVDVVGKIKIYNEEKYIFPEIIKKIDDANMETLRLLELAKIWKEQRERIQKIKEMERQIGDKEELKNTVKDEELQSIIEAEELGLLSKKENDIKSKILKIIKSYEDGVDYQTIISESGLKEHLVDITIQQLLEEGICFEPVPGKIKMV